MIDLTSHLLPHASSMDEHFVKGAHQASRVDYQTSRRLWAQRRADRGFKAVPTPLLTPPDANAKLIKGKVPSYGLTLQHTTTRVRKGLVVNACPFAGDCMKVCVLDNGNGGFTKVQEARRAKVDFLVTEPEAFAYLLGWELAKAKRQHHDTGMLFRPNVNSDVRWDLLLPSMCGLGRNPVMPGIKLYNYTKDPFVLESNGWVSPIYRVVYSWNERSDPLWADVATFLDHGGSVAMVTDRKKGENVPFRLGLPTNPRVTWTAVDADRTDEWMFRDSVIGDLSAKGRARSLVGKSGFVVTTQGAAA